MASNERLPNTLPATSPSSPVPTPAAKPTATAAPSLDKVAASLPALPSSVAGRSNSRTEEDGAAVATTAGSPLTPSPPPPVAKTSSSSNSSGLAPSAPITAPPQGYPATTGVSPRSAASFASSTASDTAAMRLHSPPAPSLAAGLAPAPPASGDAPLTAHLRQSSLSLSGTSHEARLEGLLAHKDAMISDLTGMVRRQESLLVEQDRIVQEQRATIAQKNEEIERLQKELDKMQQSLSKKQPNTPRWQRMKEAREDLIWLVTTDPAPDVAVVKYCVMNGADISYRLPLVNLPIFHYFAHEENVPCFQACMQTNEQIDFTSADDDGATVLHEAVRMNSLEKSKSILTAIVERLQRGIGDKVDWYMQDNGGRDCFTWAAHSHRLSMVWEAVKELPYFQQLTDPIPLYITVRPEDWEKLGPEGQKKFWVPRQPPPQPQPQPPGPVKQEEDKVPQTPPA